MKRRDGRRVLDKYGVVGRLAKVLYEDYNEYSLRKSALYRLLALDKSTVQSERL